MSGWSGSRGRREWPRLLAEDGMSTAGLGLAGRVLIHARVDASCSPQLSSEAVCTSSPCGCVCSSRCCSHSPLSEKLFLFNSGSLIAGCSLTMSPFLSRTFQHPHASQYHLLGARAAPLSALSVRQ